MPIDALAHFSIGQRDTLLLTLHERIFGPRLASLAICSGCGEQLELAFDAADIRAAPEVEPDEAMWLSIGDYEVRFRLPNSLDLAAVAGSSDPCATRTRLLERCTLAARHGDEATSADQLPGEVVAAMVEQMAKVDPQADIRLRLTCPECGQQWQATLDVLSYVWTELDAWAHRMLREVHVLALAYHWREVDILAMSPWRRRYYLEMVQE
jgi:hypothetical protein